MQDSKSEIGQSVTPEPPQIPNEKVELVKKLFAEGAEAFDPTGRIGLHGTSIENFVSMVKSGIITPELGKTQSQGESHDDRFYVTPHKDALKGTPQYDDVKDMSLDTVFQAAADYSSIVAFWSYIQKTLPGVLDNDWYTHFVVGKKSLGDGLRKLLPASPEGKFAYDHMLETGKKAGYELEVIERTIQEALQRRGVVLAVNLDAALKYPLLNGDRVPGKEIYIEGENLPFNGLIMGAVPMLSADKEEIFDNLQQ